MPRQVECKHLCALSADEFWSLRCDLGFDKYLAAIEKQNAEWQLNDEFRDAQGNRQLRQEVASFTDLFNKYLAKSEARVPPSRSRSPVAMALAHGHCARALRMRIAGGRALHVDEAAPLLARSPQARGTYIYRVALWPQALGQARLRCWLLLFEFIVYV